MAVLEEKMPGFELTEEMLGAHGACVAMMKSLAFVTVDEEEFDRWRPFARSAAGTEQSMISVG